MCSYFYIPTENLTRAWGIVNQCEGEEHAYHYRTAHDGIDDFYCVAPYGQCQGGPVVRCSFGGAHTWPFDKQTEAPYFGETVWAFFRANPLSAKAVDERSAAAAAAAAAG